MNKFEENFFNKYVPEGQEALGIIHIHITYILGQIFIWLGLGAIIPSFVYFYSDLIKELIPFVYLEGLLFFVFLKIVYEIFNWYNDVWIVTGHSVIQLEWSLLKTDSLSIEYDKMEGLEVEQDGLMDKIFKKGNLIIHKFGDQIVVLENANNPYGAVDFIEETSGEVDEYDNNKDDKFNMIIKTLGGVMEEYLEKKGIKEYEDSGEEKIKEIKHKKGTIDLR